MQDVRNWGEVHEVPGVETDIHAEQQVDTLLVSSCFAVVLDVIDHQGAVVDDFHKRCQLVHLLFRHWVSALSVVVDLCYEDGEKRSPLLPSSVQEIPDGFRQRLGEAIKVVVSLRVVQVGSEVANVLF